MAREATLVFEKEVPIPFTCANATAIPKGTIVRLTDPMTASAADGDNQKIAGIAAEEKVANDGKTTIAVYQKGIFKGYAGAAGVGIGDAIITDVGTGDTNELVSADVNSENPVGRALEVAVDGETFLFELNPFTINLA